VRRQLADGRLSQRSLTRRGVVSLLAALTLAGCATASTHAGTLATTSGSPCATFPEFQINKSFAGPSGATPQAALDATIAKRSLPVVGSLFTTDGYPAAGWKLVQQSTSAARFEAPMSTGSAELDLTRTGGAWVLTSGEKHC
jgi:hypothetical protein